MMYCHLFALILLTFDYMTHFMSCASLNRTLFTVNHAGSSQQREIFLSAWERYSLVEMSSNQYVPSKK